MFQVLSVTNHSRRTTCLTLSEDMPMETPVEKPSTGVGIAGKQVLVVPQPCFCDSYTIFVNDCFLAAVPSSESALRDVVM